MRDDFPTFGCPTNPIERENGDDDDDEAGGGWWRL
jgi:hypothetical protein